MKRTEIAETKLSLYARVSRRSAARAALAACVIATLPAAGCRSGRPSWNLFSRSEPSAEVLAGSGPTTTYPTPPSSRARPEAIASIAGGTATDKADVASATPETEGAEAGGPAGGANPYALAGNRMKAPENGVPTGFPTGPMMPTAPPPTVSTSVAADDNVPPSYALPGRSSAPAASDLAATANGYEGVPAATSPSKPPEAAGLPSGYQLGKEPIAGPDAAIASSPADSPSPISTSPSSNFAMPPLEGMAASGDPAQAKSGGFSLPTDLIPLPGQDVAAVPSTSPTSTPPTSTPPTSTPSGVASVNPASSPTSPAIAALDLPPVDAASAATVPDTAGAAGSPAYQTASAATSSSAPSGGGAEPSGGGVEPSGGGVAPSDVVPVGYRPGSTGKSSGYPVLR